MNRKKALVVMTALLAAMLCLLAQDAGNVQPYRQSFPEGTVDWYGGWIETHISVPLGPGPAAQARLEARRVAVIKAQAAALRLAMKIPLDSSRTLGENQALRVQVRGIVQGGEVTKEGLSRGAYDVTYRVPVSGVKGIVSIAYPVYVQTAPPPPQPPESAPTARTHQSPSAAQEEQPQQPQAQTPPPAPSGSEAQEGQAEGAGATSGGPSEKSPLASFSDVEIDASGTSAKPALFPQVKDATGKTVYSASSVDPQVAREKTIARYVAPSEEGGGKTISMMDTLRSPLACIGVLLAANAGRPARPRGDHPLVVKALKAEGRLHADIVITEEAARRIRQLEKKEGLLSKGKVVVVLRSDVGGVESRRLNRDGEALLLGRK
ncbi:MAG: hypothetical protein P8Z49_06175 [Acidobacteriota bacterium]